MTPVGQGWFLTPDGKPIEIFEHLAAVEENPGRFGLAPGDLAPQSEAERVNREVRRLRVLTQVLKNGFVRVRFSKRRRVCEYYARTLEEEAQRRAVIDAFLKRQGVLDCVIRNVCGKEEEKA